MTEVPCARGNKRCSLPGFEILLQTTESQTAGRRPLPGGSSGTELKHQAAQHLLALGRPRVLPVILDFSQGCQVKSTAGLLLHVVIQTAVNLIVIDAVYYLVA